MTYNITLTDDQFALLCKCQELLKIQDNRITENPIFGFIYNDELITNDEFNADRYIWVEYDSGEHYNFDTIEALVDYLLDDEDYYIKLKNYYCSLDFIDEKDNHGFDDVQFKEWLTTLINENDLWEIEDIIEIKKLALQKVEKIYSSCFSFFEDDVKYHYEHNAHNMPSLNIHNYAFSNFRTPLMSDLRKLLMEVKLDE